jgi:hypothetical protein
MNPRTLFLTLLTATTISAAHAASSAGTPPAEPTKATAPTDSSTIWKTIDDRKKEVLDYVVWQEREMQRNPSKRTQPNPDFERFNGGPRDLYHAIYAEIPKFEAVKNLQKTSPADPESFKFTPGLRLKVAGGGDAPPFIDPGYVWNASVKMVNETYPDCSDFVMSGFQRIMYLYWDSPLLTDAMRTELKQMVLDYPYWIDSPKQNRCVMTTENHQMLLHTAEYLAGQRYPTEVFTSDGKDGKWHQERARELILRWIDWRARFGFSEWLSSSYIEEDIVGMTNLFDFAEDPEIKYKASRLLDLMFFEMATNSLNGVYNPTQGRLYTYGLLVPDGAPSSPASYMFWGKGDYHRTLSMCGVALATSGYKPPQMIVDIALDHPAEVENKERMSYDVEELESLGIKFNDPINWGLLTGADLNTHPAYAQYALDAIPVGSRFREDAERAARSKAPYSYPPHKMPRVHTYTFRTPDFQISCAQDWHKGTTGYQQDIWNAILDKNTQVFTTSIPRTFTRNSRFCGNAFLPKAVCYRNVLVCLYKAPPSPQPVNKPKAASSPQPNSTPEPNSSPVAAASPKPSSTPSLNDQTHAWFPKFSFDEVVEKNGWVIGRKGKGYVALRTLSPATWLPPDQEWMTKLQFKTTKEGMDAAYDYLVESGTSAWICEMGSEAMNGPFEKFVEAITKAKVEGDVEKLTYESPSVGVVETGWDLPLKVGSKEIDLKHELRFDNPYCKAPFNSTAYTIQHGGKKLEIDFSKGW